MSEGFQLVDVAFSIGGILVLGSFVYLVLVVVAHRDLGVATDAEVRRRRDTSSTHKDHAAVELDDRRTSSAGRVVID
jgi:hypothetical protein